MAGITIISLAMIQTSFMSSFSAEDKFWRCNRISKMFFISEAVVLRIFSCVSRLLTLYTACP